MTRRLASNGTAAGWRLAWPRISPDSWPNQAKGREWDVVGVRLGTGEQRSARTRTERQRRGPPPALRGTHPCQAGHHGNLPNDPRFEARGCSGPISVATELPGIQRCAVAMRITHVEAAVGPGESLSYVLRHKIFPNWHIVAADILIWLTYTILLTATMAVFGLAWTRLTRPSISDLG